MAAFTLSGLIPLVGESPKETVGGGTTGGVLVVVVDCCGLMVINKEAPAVYGLLSLSTPDAKIGTVHEPTETEGVIVNTKSDFPYFTLLLTGAEANVCDSVIPEGIPLTGTAGAVMVTEPVGVRVNVLVITTVVVGFTKEIESDTGLIERPETGQGETETDTKLVSALFVGSIVLYAAPPNK
jgi:hypothetical protein